MNLTTKNNFAVLAFGLAMISAGCSSKVSQSSNLDPRFLGNDSVQFIQDGASVASAGQVSTLASGLSISIALTVNPPSTSLTGGTQLYASDLKVYGNKVLTAYNSPGNVQRGWVDFIDVTTLAVPLLLGSQYFSDTDINSVAMTSGKFALVGAKDSVGTVLRTGTYTGLGFTTSTTETFPSAFGSYAGTGVTFNSTGTNLGMTSGDTGGVNVLNGTTLANITSATSVSDARGITYSATTGKYYVVKGQSGQVISFDASGNQVATSASIGAASIPQSKSTIVAGNTYLLATSGDGGFAVLCASDLTVLAQQAQYTYSNYASLGLPAPALTVSNAAAFGPGMIFVAAGQAGVRVYNFVKNSATTTSACQNIQVSYMGYFEFSNTLSANNLVYANVLTTALTYTGVLYVADGGGGFKAVTVVATKSSLNDIVDF